MQLVDPAIDPDPYGRRGPVVDVVVPVFNEEVVLARSIRRLHTYLSTRFPFTWQITIVDNASTDRTWARARALSEELPHVRAAHLDRKGRGLALRTAWLASDADVVAYTDVDLSTDLDALLPLVAPLVSGHSDVAIGSRLAAASSVARAPRRELVSRSYNLILRTVLATRVHDAQCGFKAVRRDIARRLVPAIRDDGWFFDTEMLLLAERNGLRIHEVPVDWIDDPDSRVNIVDTALGDLRGTARMARTFARGEGTIDFGAAARRPLDDDFGRRLVTFGLIGALSTVVSLALFLLLRRALGPVGANAVAVSATFVANTWANARLTVRAHRPRWARSFVIYLGSLALTSASLGLVDAFGGGLAAELAALAVTWSAATIGRLALVSRDATRPAAPRPTAHPAPRTPR
jgi:glycosyltransferase involved in cell wall biosynthesis